MMYAAVNRYMKKSEGFVRKWVKRYNKTKSLTTYRDVVPGAQQRKKTTKLSLGYLRKILGICYGERIIFY